MSEDDEPPEARRSEVTDDATEEGQYTQTATKGKSRRKVRQKKHKDDLKSKTTGVGIKISADSAPTNSRIVFDDSNLPTDEDDNEDNSTNGEDKDEDFDRETTMKEKDSDDDIGDDEEDDDAVEEVQGKAARDEAMDQMKTEAKQSLKTKKQRKRKPRVEKIKEGAAKTNEANGDDSDDGDEMDDEFFAQLDSVRQQEMEEKKVLEREAARAASKGKHTTFVFAKNENDDDNEGDPARRINENMQVVVLKNPSSSASGANGSFAPNTTSISEKALLYSRNRLKDGVDRKAGDIEMKRKLNRSGEDIQPWKRARPRLSMGRSRLRKGKPAAFFGRSKKR